MKDTDKITLSFGQLKRLVRESAETLRTVTRESADRKTYRTRKNLKESIRRRRRLPTADFRTQE